MKFIKPKNNNADGVDWLISERVRAIVKTYERNLHRFYESIFSHSKATQIPSESPFNQVRTLSSFLEFRF